MHLALLGALWLVISAARIWWVGIPSLLFGVHGPLTGASFVDLHVRMPGL
jgi:uncharacterized membrane protein (UPF0182 family)